MVVAETEKISLGSFGIENDSRVSKSHTRFLVDKKQNITLSFDPVSMICYNCAGGGHRVCNEGGGGGWGRSSFFLTKTFLQLFHVPLLNVLRLLESKMDHCRNFPVLAGHHKRKRYPCRICCRYLLSNPPAHGGTKWLCFGHGAGAEKIRLHIRRGIVCHPWSSDSDGRLYEP